MGRRLFTEEQLAFIKENLPGRPYAEMATLVNSRFCTSLSANQILSLIKRNGWKNGCPSGFQPVPIGSEGLQGNYVIVKTASAQWRYKHAAIWESIHGPIPPGHMVVFGDGNRRNFDPSNLFLVSKRAITIMTKAGLISNNTELMEAAKAIANLRLAIWDKSKGVCK